MRDWKTAACLSLQLWNWMDEKSAQRSINVPRVLCLYTIKGRIILNYKNNAYVSFAFFLVVRDNFKTLCIQINLPAHDALNQKNNKSFHFYWKGILLQFLEKSHFLKNYHEFGKFILKLTRDKSYIFCGLLLLVHIPQDINSPFFNQKS